MKQVSRLIFALLCLGGVAFAQGSLLGPFDPPAAGNSAVTSGTLAGSFTSVSTVSDGVHPGSTSLPGNTTLPTLPANNIVDAGPNVTTFTAWGKQWPSAGPGVPAAMCLSALSSSWTTISWCPFTGSGGTIVQSVSPTLTTPNLGTPSAINLANASGSPTLTQVTVTTPDAVSTANCLAATVVTTPCLAYSSVLTGLSNSSTTGTITIYSSNAPANAVLEYCADITTDSPSSAGGTATSTVTWNSPGTGTWTNGYPQSLSSYGSNLGCSTYTLKSGSTFSFVTVASGVTSGTATWETSPIIMRMH